MARGWESKSVEDQQAEAARNKPAPKTQLTPTQVVCERELQGLRLSRARVLHQLDAARDQLAVGAASDLAGQKHQPPRFDHFGKRQSRDRHKGMQNGADR